jgi:hypothetical protein
MKLVLWKDMMKGSKEDLPLRPFETQLEAEAYVTGIVDIIVIQSKNKKLEWEEVRNDFEIIEGGDMGINEENVKA